MVRNGWVRLGNWHLCRWTYLVAWEETSSMKWGPTETHLNSYLVLMKSEKHWAQRGVRWKRRFQFLHITLFHQWFIHFIHTAVFKVSCNSWNHSAIFNRFYYIPSQKLTASLALKMDGWKMKFPFGARPIFRCELLNFREGNRPYHITLWKPYVLFGVHLPPHDSCRGRPSGPAIVGAVSQST